MLLVVIVWPLTAAAQRAARGAQLFQELDCADCHGGRAQGDVGPRLTATRLELAAVIAQLRAPRGMMPVYGPDRLSDEEITSLYAWLQSLPDELAFPTWFSSELINLATPKMPGAKTLEVHFSHRFNESIGDAGFQGFWGLDSFATPAFWFAYGITDRLQVHGGRSSNRGTWEYGAKVALLDEQPPGVPLSVSAVVGGAYLDRDNVVNKNRFTLEMPVGWRVHERVSLLLTPLLATDTDPSGDPASDAYSAALGVGGTFRFTPRQSIDAEWVRNVAGFRNADAVDQWAAYWGIKVGGHVFQIGVSNSVDYTADQMAPGALALGRTSDVRLGFNLVRAFKLGGG
ncbi:MAG: DUF5777 family beta-barrel protein [Acidobacteriota bacterium]|jgi:cytochrome c553